MIEGESSYKKALLRYEELSGSNKNTPKHKEMMLLAFLINKYENSKWPAFEMDPVEIGKIRMEEFGHRIA